MEVGERRGRIQALGAMWFKTSQRIAGLQTPSSLGKGARSDPTKPTSLVHQLQPPESTPSLLKPRLVLSITVTEKKPPRDLPGGPVAESVLPVRKAWVQSPVRERKSHKTDKR